MSEKIWRKCEHPTLWRRIYLIIWISAIYFFSTSQKTLYLLVNFSWRCCHASFAAVLQIFDRCKIFLNLESKVSPGLILNVPQKRIAINGQNQCQCYVGERNPILTIAERDFSFIRFSSLDLSPALFLCLSSAIPIWIIHLVREKNRDWIKWRRIIVIWTQWVSCEWVRLLNQAMWNEGEKYADGNLIKLLFFVRSNLLLLIVFSVWTHREWNMRVFRLLILQSATDGWESKSLFLGYEKSIKIWNSMIPE